MNKIHRAFILLYVVMIMIALGCMPEEQEFIKPTPVASHATEVTTSGFKAIWKPLLGAQSYKLEVATDASFEEEFMVGETPIEVQDTFHVVKNLKVAQSYYYRINAHLSTGERTDYSNTIVANTLGIPRPVALTATEIATTKFTARWQPVDEATTYIVEVATDIEFADAFSIQRLVTEDTSVLVKDGLKVDQNYFYRVIAKNGNIQSGFSNVIHVTTTQLTQPIGLSVSDTTQTQFRIHWEPVSGATNYTVAVTTDPLFLDTSAFVVHNELTNEHTFMAAGLSANTSYYYRVRANNDRSFSEYSAIGVVTTLALDIPVALAASEIQYNEFKAHWHRVASADSYALEVATNEQFTQQVEGYAPIVLDDTSILITGLQQNTLYYYRVSAQGLNAQSVPSNTIELTTKLLPGPVAQVASNIGSTTFSAVWTQVHEAEAYSLEVATDPDFHTVSLIIHDVMDTTYSIQGLASNQTYYYRVRAKLETNYSTYSNIISQHLVALDQPVNVVSSNITYDSFMASWDVVSEAVRYSVDVAIDDQFGNILTNYQEKILNGTSIGVAGLAPGTTYYLRVKAQNDYSASDYSEKISITTATVGVPTAQPPASVGAYEMYANWALVSNASSYLLDVATDAGFTEILPGYESLPVTATYFPVDNLQPATSYHYRVRAVANGHTSDYSNTITVVTDENLVVKVPGLIEAEELAVSAGIDRIYAAASSNQYYIGSIEQGDWAEYEIEAQYNDTYTIEFRVANSSSGGTINIMQGATTLGSVVVGDTGGWETWTTVSTTITLSSGTQNIRLEFVGGAGTLLNIDRINLEANSF